MLEAIEGNGASAAGEAVPTPKAAAAAAGTPRPIRGPAATLARFMNASLGVPTATSFRTIVVDVLDERRRALKQSGRRLSFTHLIAWALIQAAREMTAMAVVYTEVEGKPHALEPDGIHLGLAVDVERGEGQRFLVTPVLAGADALDFARFTARYDELVAGARDNSLPPDAYAGANMSLTNPGGIGTVASVPRLMPGQGTIVATGAIGYPPGLGQVAPEKLAELGVAKVMTLSSTYDHRVIQGAESGQFLATVHDLLLGSERFYDEIFAALKIPYEPVGWSRDRGGVDGLNQELEKQSRVIQLINMYRVRGHVLAELNPISWEVLSHPELDLSYYGLTVWDLDREFLTDGLPGPRKQPLRQIIDRLRDVYCRTVGVEYMHISDPDQKRWIQKRVESEMGDELSKEEKLHVLDRLSAAEAFERFLHSKYTGHKRFSLEGAESLIVMLDALLEEAADDGMVESVMGMAHRGRLNVLANAVGKPLKEIFKEFEGSIDEDTVQGSGDVKYHLGMTGRFASRQGNELAIVLASNPSHLEAVDPVVEGMTRAKQDVLQDAGENNPWARIMPLLLHGDAAFAGQGVVAETFNFSGVRGYRTGGTVHIVVNNLIGFTTAPHAGRSAFYATDVAKMVQAPILHVNGDDPEACWRVVKLAFAYRREFNRDIVIDLVCYRRYGHNEGDEPAFTQPLMYAKIDERRSVRKIYTEKLLNKGELSLEEAEESFEKFRERLQEAFKETQETVAERKAKRAAPPPKPTGVLEPVETGVERARLDHIQRTLTTFPEGFEPHPKLAKQVEKRRDLLERDAIDWAGAEALAFGSLLLEGFTVRLSGQDSRRGTFSQRHSVMVDHRTGEEYFPLNQLGPDQGRHRTHDSILSEFAVLGFEYGYSVANGDALVCWEAQFGDFVNGGQVIIDQFMVAGEDKWNQTSGLVLLLPHGYEGQGPEHSSARLERFLTLAAEDSIQVAEPSTPANYFHLLRRQMHRTVRKPLVVLTPKWLLRLPDARSKTEALVNGHFRETLDDPRVKDPENVERILLCTGKIAYQLLGEREKRDAPAAICTVEQLYPFPKQQLFEIFDRYPNATEVRWMQEEPENMGAWFSVSHRLRDGLDQRLRLKYGARPESASPATGSATVHEQEQEELLASAFEGLD